MRPIAIAVAAAAILALAGCPSDDVCVEVNVDCQPLYEPTFDNVYSQTLEPKCGVDGACHNAVAARGGLVFEDPDEAYDLLLGATDGRERVIPFDAGCSLVTRRIESTRVSFQMPPGDMLSASERCSIIQWIDLGAER